MRQQFACRPQPCVSILQSCVFRRTPELAELDLLGVTRQVLCGKEHLWRWVWSVAACGRGLRRAEPKRFARQAYLNERVHLLLKLWEHHAGLVDVDRTVLGIGIPA